MKSCAITIITLAALSAGSAGASVILNFATGQSNSSGNSFGDSLNYSTGGIDVTETGWSVASTSSSTKFAQAAVDNYSGTNLGLGVCSSNDPSGSGCSSPYHQIDNSNTSGGKGPGDEFVMFQFSGPVNLSQIQVTNYASIDGSTAVDLTFYSASTALTTSTTIGSLGTGTTVTGDSGSGNQVTYNVSGANATDVSYLIVGASVPDVGTVVDSFKLNAITVSSFTATPEPASFAMLGMGLIATGLAGYRRRKSAR